MNLATLFLVLLAIVHSKVAAQGATLVFFGASFGNNAQSSFLALSFTANIDTSCDATKVTLYSSSETLSATSITLTGGTCNYNPDQGTMTLVLSLVQQDYDAIFATPDLCTIETNCFIGLEVGFTHGILDSNPSNPVAPPFMSQALQLPETDINIVTANIDLDSGSLFLQFENVINSVNVSILTVTKESVLTLQLTGPEQFILPQPSLNTTIPLLQSDINQLKLVVETPPNITAWQINFPSGSVQGDGGLVNSATDLNLIILPDNTSPNFVSFTLDMNLGVLKVTFDEFMSETTTTSLMFLTPGPSIPTPNNFTLDGSNVTLSVDLLSFEIVFSQTLFTDIQAHEVIAKSISTTYLYLAPESYFDLSSNTINKANAIQASELTLETEPPTLLSFSMMVDFGVLRMTFSEPMSVASLSLDQITLFVSPQHHMPLTNEESFEFTETNTLLTITLTTSTLNSLKLLFFDAQTNILSIALTAEAISDSSSNDIVAIPISAPLPSSTLDLDSMHPLLTEFTVIAGPPETYALNFTFSEYMNLSSFDPSALTLILDSNSIGSVEYTALNGGETVSYGYTAISYELSSDDLVMTSLADFYQIAYYSGNISILFTPDLVSDLAGLIINAPLLPTVYQSQDSDPVSPSLSSFTLDLVMETLLITFTESVVPLGAPGSIIILDAIPDATFSVNINFTSYSNLPRVSATSFTLPLDINDVNALLSTDSIATDVTNTFLFVQPAFGIDLGGNSISEGEGLQASDVILPEVTQTTMSTIAPTMSTLMSTTPSTLMTMSTSASTLITMSTTMMTTASTLMTMSPTMTTMSTTASTLVTMSTTASTVMTMSTSASTLMTMSTTASTVTTTMMTTSTAASTMTTQITPSTVSNSDATATSATLETSSIIVASSSEPLSSSGLTTSMTPSLSTTVPSSSSAEVISSSSTSFSESTMTTDTMTMSSAREMSIDMSPSPSPLVSIVVSPSPSPVVFSPIVMNTTSFDLDSGELTIEFSENIQLSLVGENGQFYITDTVAEYYITNVNNVNFLSQFSQTSIVIVLDSEDVLNIKALRVNSTWSLGVTQGAVVDMNFNAIAPQVLQFFNYTMDSTPPQLSSFDLDLNLDTLVITFDEPIDINSIDLTDIYFTSMLIHSPLGYQLTGGVIEPNELPNVLSIQLPTSILNEIKFDISVATVEENTNIFYQSGNLSDYYGNIVQSPGLSMSVNTLVQDATSPELIDYQLDLNSGVMTVTFSEPINTDTIDINGVSITKDSSPNPVSLSASFTNVQFVGASQQNTQASLQFVFNLEVVKYVLFNSSVAYMTIPATFIEDIAGNQVMAITSDNRLKSTDIIPDSVEPSIAGINPTAISPGDASISFSFDEYMLLSSADESAISIQISSETFTGFSGGIWSAATNDTVQYQFSDGDLLNNSFGSDYIIATNAGQMFITFGFTFVTDLGHNYATVPGSLLPYMGTQSDFTAPRLSSFDLDTDSGTLTLVFSEAVIISSISLFQLQNAATDATITYTLTTSQWEQYYGSNILIRLSDDDTTNLVNVTGFASTIEDTFIQPFASLARDYSGNDISPLGAVQASSVLTPFTPETPPTLTSAQLDLNAGSVMFYFDKSIDIGSTDSSGIVITDGDKSVTLTTDSIVVQGDNNTIAIVYPQTADLNLIKYTVAMSESTFSVSIGNNTFFNADKVGNVEQSVVVSVIADTMAPMVDSFSLDMDKGILLVTFIEPMNNATYNTSNLWLNGLSSMEPAGYQLFNSIVTASYNTYTTLEITLTVEVLNDVKTDSSVAINSNSSFLFFDMGAFQDVFDNLLTKSSDSLQSSQFTEDITRPSLLSYNLDLNTAVLTLSFDEPVDRDSIDPSGIRIFNFDQTDHVIVTNSASVTGTGYSLTADITVVAGTLDNLKVLLATSSQTYLSMTTDTVFDTNGNFIIAIEDSNPLLSSSLTKDTVRPSVVSVMIGDETERTVTLTFDELIQPSSWNGNGLILTLNSSTGSVTYTTFTDGSVTQAVSSTITYTISNSKFEPPLSIHYQQAYYSGSIGVSFGSSLIEDISGNGVQSLDNPLYYTSNVNDPVKPRLTGFDLDLDTSLLVMTFTEDIVVDNIMTNVQFQNSQSSPSQVFTLTSSSYSSQNGVYGSVIELTLSTADVKSLANNNMLASSLNNTFLRVSTGLAVDYSGNFLIANDQGIQASSFMMLLGPINPTITSFDLDLDSDQLTFHLDTPVDVSTFVPSRVTLVNESSVGVDTYQIQLSNTTVIAQGIQTEFRILLSTSNIIDIKRHPLCYTSDNCYATFTEGVVASTDNLPSQAVSVPQRVSSLSQDVTPPRFLSFPVFDLNSGFFAIVFSEPVNGSSTDFTQIQFGNTMTNPTETVLLTEGYTSPDHVELDFHLTNKDLNQIKYHLSLCTSASNCWLRLPSFVLADIGSNPFLHSNYKPGADASFHSPSVFVSDVTPPTLNEVSVDMHLGKIMLSFDEVVDESGFLPTDVTVFDQPSGDFYLTLSNVTDFSVVENGTKLEISLTNEDLNWVKSRDMFSSTNDSFISFVTQMTDVSDNKFTDIPPNAAKKATQFIPDMKTPELLSFELFNIDNGSMLLSFDEPMNEDSFNPLAIILVNGDSVSYALTGGTATAITDEKTLIMIVLATSDRVNIKLTSGLAKSVDTTFVALGSSALEDRSGNLNAEISLASAIQLVSGSYVEDTSPCGLLSVLVDMDSAMIRLNFDDVVDAETFEPRFLTIQNQSNIANSISYTLEDSIIISSSSDVVRLNISHIDTTSLKSQLLLAKSVANTFVSFSTSIGRDIEGRTLTAVPSSNAVQVTTYINDQTAPRLLSYNLDVDQGEMMLTFNEPVLISSFNPIGLTFQDAAQTPSSAYVLQGGIVLPQSDGSAADAQVTLEMSAVDLNEVKSNTNIATAKTDTYIAVDPSLIADTSANSIQTVTGMNSQDYLPDVTLPILVESSIDITNGGKLILTFSEAVQYTPVFLTSVQIQNSLTNPTQTIILQDTIDSVAKTDLHVVTVTLSNANTNRISNDHSIASTTSNAYVSMVSGGVFDYSQGGVGQSINPVTTRVDYMYVTCFSQNTYNNIEKGTCDSCSSVCVGGCTGSGSYVGEGGCGLCDVIEVDVDLNQIRCLPINSDCSESHYSDSSTLISGLTSNGHLCRPCHEDCSTCSGSGTENCDSCQTALQLDGATIVQCLTSCTPDNADCYYCHSECNGCVGPSNTDCISCMGQSQQNSNGQMVCVPSCTAEEYLAEINGEFICIPCHKECQGCTGPSNSECKLCKNYNNTIIAGIDECSPRCLFGSYADSSSTCKPCNAQCDGCTGPSSSNCTQCTEDSVSVTGETVCVPTCPMLQDYDISKRSCTLSQTGQTIVIAVSCSFGVLLILIVILVACVCVCRCKKSYKPYGDFDLSTKTTDSDKVSFIRSSRLFHTTSKL